MKRSFWKMSSILATLGLALALVFTSCGDDNGGGSGALGATLELRGQVYTAYWAEDAFVAAVFTPFTGSRTVVSHLPGGTGAIANGQLTFSFGRPATEYLYLLTSLFGEDDDFPITVSPTTARGAWLWMYTRTGDTENGSLRRRHETGNATSFTYREVLYVFVDRDVIVSSPSGTERFECECGTCDCVEYDDACFCNETFTRRGFNITLKEGWNALHERWELRLGANNHVTSTVSISHENPGSPLRWVFDDWTREGRSADIDGRAPCCRTRTDARPSFRNRR